TVVLVRRPPPRSPLFPYTTLFRSLLPIGRRAVRERIGRHAPARVALQPVVADRGGRREPLLDVAGLEHAAASVRVARPDAGVARSEEHTSELQSRENLVCRLLLGK